MTFKCLCKDISLPFFVNFNQITNLGVGILRSKQLARFDGNKLINKLLWITAIAVPTLVVAANNLKNLLNKLLTFDSSWC